jgi:tetratricopeptide (TPR) repeat protein
VSGLAGIQAWDGLRAGGAIIRALALRVRDRAIIRQMRQFLFSVIAISGALPLGALAQSMQGMENQHSHAGMEMGEKLGKVSFPTSCARSQAAMERGVALLHSFGYTEAQMQFEAITKDDPTCAMGHWGVAMSQFHQLWGPPDEAALKLGAEQMASARDAATPPAAITPREQAYIEALSAFYRDPAAKYQQRADAYEAKMNELHARFPDDVEGAAFDALAILAAVSPDDTSLTHQHQALAILLPLFASHPEHPGLAHYIIHTCDTPALAADGLAAARVYAKIAPSSAHALHMPGHIFARLGMWDEDIASNVASVEASNRAAAAKQPGAAHQMHAQEFLIYAYLQTGEDEKARVLTGKMREVGQRMKAMPGMDDMKDGGNFFDNELNTIYALEMHDWKKMTALKPAPGSKPEESAYIYWGHGVAAGHLRDAKLAQTAVARLDECREAVKKSEFAFFDTYMGVMRDEMLGWKAYAENKPDEAVSAMRKAADQQDKLGQAEVDIPAREMLGDLLLMQHKPAEALAEYRVALKLSPNRLNGLLSAGRAAEEANLQDEARGFYKAAAAQTQSGAHSKRQEVAHAVKATAGL